MSELIYDQIPSLDLADFTTGNSIQRQKFVTDLGAAYNNIGFVAVRNHDLSPEVSVALYDAIRKFFSLPDEVKRKYEIPELSGQRGYVGKGKEHARGRNTGDLKEFYHVGQEVQDGDPVRIEYPENIWPVEVPEFREIALDAYRRLENTGVQVLRAVALYLNLKEDYFDSRVRNGNSILRPIHYFPIESATHLPADAVRAAEHGDINLITLLMGASADGLQVLRQDGRWIPITALPDQLVVNVGDMLERITNKKLRSTIHRVVNPPPHLMRTPRYSIPFFMHPRSDTSLAALSGCVSAQRPKIWEDITAGEFLHQRLIEIGLKK